METDLPSPINVYGETKFAGEQAVHDVYAAATIVRISWIHSPYGKNFIATMLRLARTQGEIAIVGDQIGCPTSANDVASAIFSATAKDLGKALEGEIFHLSNFGSATWFQLAEYAISQGSRIGLPQPKLRKISTSDYPTPARRPMNSRLDTCKFTRRTQIAMRPWQDAARETVEQLLTNVH